MILFVEDLADASVGIFPRTYEVPCPFEKDEAEKEDLEFFRIEMINVYKEYAQGKIKAIYDFEYAAMP